MSECFVYKRNGEITNKREVREFFDSLKADGLWLLKSEHADSRSSNQNRYLHGVVIPLVFQGLRDAGFDDVRDKEDAKTVIKTLFLKRKIRNKETEDVIEVVRRTRDLTTFEMMEFLEEVCKWSQEYLSVYIPPPGEQAKLAI